MHAVPPAALTPRADSDSSELSLRDSERESEPDALRDSDPDSDSSGRCGRRMRPLTRAATPDSPSHNKRWNSAAEEVQDGTGAFRTHALSRL